MPSHTEEERLKSPGAQTGLIPGSGPQEQAAMQRGALPAPPQRGGGIFGAPAAPGAVPSTMAQVGRTLLDALTVFGASEHHIAPQYRTGSMQKAISAITTRREQEEMLSDLRYLTTLHMDGRPEALKAIRDYMPNIRHPQVIEMAGRIHKDLNQKATMVLGLRTAAKDTPLFGQMADMIEGGIPPELVPQYITASTNAEKERKQVVLADGAFGVFNMKTEKMEWHVAPQLKKQPTTTDMEKTWAAVARSEGFGEWEDLNERARKGDKTAQAQMSVVLHKGQSEKVTNDADRYAIAMYGSNGSEKKLGAKSFADLDKMGPGYATSVLNQIKADELKAKGLGVYEAEMARQKADLAKRVEVKENFWYVKSFLKKGSTPESVQGITHKELYDHWATRKLRDKSGKDIGENPQEIIQTTEEMGKDIRRVEIAEKTLIPTMKATMKDLAPKAGIQVLFQRIQVPLLQGMGSPGLPTQLGVLEAFNLFMGRIFQGGAASQLSDKDVAASKMANLSASDSIESAQIKVEIMERLFWVHKAAAAGINLKDRGISEFSGPEIVAIEKKLKKHDKGNLGPGIGD